MVHSDHLGRTLGFQVGAKVARERLMLAFFYYGRSGPINPHTQTVAFPEGVTYKGQSGIDVRADHAAFGVMVAPQFPLAGGRLTLDIPVSFGQIGAGFYLTGEDRDTPDGRTVSAWENDLFNQADASFGYLLEGGLRLRTTLSPASGIEAGIGVHYSRVLGWDTYVGGTDYYNLPRISLFLLFGN